MVRVETNVLQLTNVWKASASAPLRQSFVTKLVWMFSTLLSTVVAVEMLATLVCFALQENVSVTKTKLSVMELA